MLKIVNALMSDHLFAHVYGYKSDETSCVDIDECQLLTDNCPVDSTCSNTDGSFSCACNAGFFGSGNTCLDFDECSFETGTCSPDGSCANTHGSYTCKCNEGFVGDGFVCDVDICNLCEVGTTCDGSTCQCPSRKSGTGVSRGASSQTSSTVKKTVIPLSKIPEISVRTTKCTDSY